MKNRARYSGFILPAILILIILSMAGISWGASPQLAAGAAHTVQLHSDGTLWGTGVNVFGQLGDGTLTSKVLPVPIGADSNWITVVAGADHNLALKADGTLWSWGSNQFGQLGDGTKINRAKPVRIGFANDWIAVDAGDANSFALKADGTIWGWGRNSAGQLGNGDPSPVPADRLVPVLVANMGTSPYVAISAGGKHALALQADGTLWAWGDNQFGQIGQGATDAAPHATPAQIGTDSSWTAVSAGGLHSLALKANGALWAWGDNQFGQVGQGPLTPQQVPLQVGTDRDWVALSAGDLHSLAVKRNGTLWGWGENTAGQLGDGTTMQLNMPLQITAPTDITDIVAVSAGTYHSLAINANGKLYAWGDNGAGQLGNGTTAGAFSPQLVGTDVTSWVATESGGEFTLARKSNGTLWTWGGNSSGQLGDNSNIFSPRLTPAMVGTATNWVAQAAGWSHAVALKADGTLWTWGGNSSGQLGDGTTTNRQAPTQITAAKSWAAVAAGDFHTLALKTDGTLWAWGDNLRGQIGDGTTTQRSVPVQVIAANPGNSGFDSHWVAIAAGGSHSLALQADGTLWVWGDNSSGQLGNSAFGSGINAPRQIVNFTPPTPGYNSSWVAIAAGLSHSLALQADGTLWAWGSNFSGQLGNGDTAVPNPPDQPAPVQVLNPGAASYVAFAAGDSFSVARQADGTLWSWGNNTSGQLGNGVTDLDPLQPVSHPFPVQESSASANWVVAGSGGSHAVALKASGSLWAWGNNTKGQLGDGTTTSRNTPAPFMEERIVVTPAVYFNDVAIGAQLTQSVTIGNTGTAPLSVSSLTIGGADPAMFGVTAAGSCGAAPFTVAAGGSCTVNVVFAPIAPAAARSATLTIASSDPDFPAVPVNLVARFTITASVSAGGTITPAGALLVISGANPAFTVTPDTGFHVVDVKVDGVSQGAVTSLVLPSVTGSSAITATFAINTYTVTMNGANGAITGPATVNYGDTPSYLIAPATGFHLVDVTVNGVSKGALPAVTLPPVTGNVTITAIFAINAYTITRTAGANGSITGPTTANHGETPVYAVTPNVGYHLADVAVNGVSKGADLSLIMPPLTGNATIAVSFAINTYAVTKNVNGNGSITGPSTANHGDMPTYTITPAANYHVVDVKVDGVSQGAVTTLTLPAVTADKVIAATFAFNAVQVVTAANDGKGSIAPSGAVNVDFGANQTFSFTPSTGYGIVNVLVDGVPQGALTSYTFTNVTSSHTIKLVCIPDGDVNNDGKVDIADALIALRIAVDLVTPSAMNILHGDAAPLDAGGIPIPDQKIMVADALMILRKVIGLTSGW